MTTDDSTREAVRRWVQAYVDAWSSNDPNEIGALFTTDAEYRTEPWATPWQGRARIVEEWIARKDEPGDHTFTWDVVGVEAGRAFVQGETRYDNGRTYSNLWIVDLADDGSARAFTEWWMHHRDPS